MLFKDKTIAFIHRSAQRLKLTYQSTLQCVQLLNLIDAHAAHQLNLATKQQYHPVFATALLSLCCKLHEVKPLSIRDLAKLIHPNYRHFNLQELEKDEKQSDQPTNSQNLSEIELQLKEWEVKIMLMLRWKISVPLLYDQVIKIALMWDKYTSFLEDFPLRFESESCGSQGECSSNHNFLASRVCIVVYNLSHLIKGTALQQVSEKCRRLAVALFAVLIRKLMREKYKLKQYILSPKYSLEHMLQEFYNKELQVSLSKIKIDTDSILSTLDNYQAFKELSREKECKKGKQDKIKKKRPTASQKISEEKENIAYYVTLGNKSKHKKRCGSELNDQTKKNRSRTKKEKPVEIKEVKTYWLKDSSKILKEYNNREIQTMQKQPRIGKQLKESTREIKESFRQKQNKKSHKELQPQRIQNSKIIKEKPRMIKPRGSVIKANNKKSNSTKSIVSKNVSSIKNDKLQHHPRNDKLPFSKSRASKRSDKSQLNSKLLPMGQEEEFASKSTYWLRATTLAKTDKKSTNSSTRMKLR